MQEPTTPTRCRIVEVVTPDAVYAAIVTGVREDGSIDATAFKPAQGGTREFVCLRSAAELEANERIDRRGRAHAEPVKPEETAHWRWPRRGVEVAEDAPPLQP